jgi:hypothetical protein
VTPVEPAGSSGAGRTPAQPVRWHLETSWDELVLHDSGRGSVHRRVPVGLPDDETAPLIIRAKFEPGHRIEPHTHACDYVEIIIEGTEEVTRRWRSAGDVTVVKAGTVYGPLIAGPDGVEKMLVFRDGRYAPIFASDLARGGTSLPNSDPSVDL